jgi:hypothetical protein
MESTFRCLPVAATVHMGRRRVEQRPPRYELGYSPQGFLPISLYVYTSNINNKNNWLQHPNSKGTRGCAAAPAMVL